VYSIKYIEAGVIKLPLLSYSNNRQKNVLDQFLFYLIDTWQTEQNYVTKRKF